MEMESCAFKIKGLIEDWFEVVILIFSLAFRFFVM